MALTRQAAVASSLLAIAAIVNVMACPSVAQVRVQLGGQIEQGGPEDSFAQVYLPTDRQLARGMNRAKERIAEGEYSQAIRFLDDVLRDDREDYFLPTANAEGEYRGLKEAARDLIAELPEDGMALYQAMYGPAAQRDLERARTLGDIDAVRRVAFRYSQTLAGCEAALLLAQQQTDLGHYVSAALIYDELKESKLAARFEPQLSLLAAEAWVAAGDRAKAEVTLRTLSSQGHRSVVVGGKKRQLKGLADAPLDWLQRRVGSPTNSAELGEAEWLTFRGDARRNAHTNGGLPHMRERWAVRLLGHPELEEFHDTLIGGKLRSRSSMAVATSPIAVGDYIITRSAHNLLAVDSRTGKRIWRSQPQRVPAFDLLGSKSEPQASNQLENSPLQTLSQRLWSDYLYGSISSDAERVFVIRDLTTPKSLQHQFLGGFGFRAETGELDSVGTNRLCAYELASQGKLVWEADGAIEGSELSGAFFLGAPVWVGESLYALAEIKSAVYLVALDRRTGAFQWQQQLVGVEANILLDVERRLQAATPSYESGILVCPTGSGVVVGVDLGKRALRWAYRYRADRSTVNLFRSRSRRTKKPQTRWSDAAVVIEAGKVLISPPESGELHCLDLVTGEPVWKQKRREGLWLAGACEGRVLVVSNSELVALDLETGEPAWAKQKLRLSRDAQPSGRGFFSDQYYYQPLTTAEVIAVDMRTGKVNSRAKSRDGRVLGNLICHRGSVLSQTGDQLHCFDLVEALRSKAESVLETKPNDADSLRALGEIAYNEGQLDRAIEYLERALSDDQQDMRAKSVLVECLEVALTEDFAKNRDRLPLLKELISSTGSADSSLLRLQAKGKLDMGDVLGAFAACRRLYESIENIDVIQEFDRGHQTTWGRWIQSQMCLIWDEAAEEERREIEESLLVLLARVDAGPTNDGLERFAECFEGLPPGELSLFQLAENYFEAGSVHRAQQIYLTLVESEDEVVRAASVARCSQLLHERGLQRLAASFDDLLRTELADKVCLDGKTGRQCLSDWGPSSQLLTGLDWPLGEVDISTVPMSSRHTGRHVPISRIRLERCDSVLGPCSVLSSTRTNGRVEVRNSVGTMFFSAVLDETRRIAVHDISSFYGVTRGNLLLVSQGNRIIAFNTLADLDSADEKILWKEDVVQAVDLQNQHQYRVVVSGRSVRRIAPSKAPRASQENRWIGVIGPVTHNSCIFQDQRRLKCIDPISGELKWARKDVPVGCDLYGDKEVVVVVEPNSTTGLLFSTIDGRSLGQVSVPNWEEQLATIGRRVVSWKKTDRGKLELASVDVVSGKKGWSREFEPGSRVDIAEGRFVAVAEPARPRGRCLIFDATTGEQLVEHELQLNETCRNIYLMAGRDSFVVATERHFKPSRERQVRALNNWDFRVIDGGIYLFDRVTGEALWERPAEVKQESLMLAQPVDLPVISFAGTVHHRTRSGGRPATSLLMLEKATGRLLYHNDKLPQAGANYCALRLVDQSKAEMEVEMASKTVRLKFTDRPRPAEPPAVVDGPPDAPEESEGLFGIGRKLFGQ